MFPLKKLISQSKTKKELAAFLAKKTLKYAEANGKQFVVAWENAKRLTKM